MHAVPIATNSALLAGIIGPGKLCVGLVCTIFGTSLSMGLTHAAVDGLICVLKQVTCAWCAVCYALPLCFGVFVQVFAILLAEFSP